jgi:vancomycin resistance protein YoaR
MSKFLLKFTKQRNRRLMLLASILILLLPIEAYLMYNLLYLSKIFPNVYANSLELGSLSRQKAVDKLKTTEMLIPTTLAFSYQNQSFTLESASFDFKIDEEKTIGNAYAIGRLDDPLANAIARFNLLFQPSIIPFQLRYLEANLDQSIASMAAVIDEPTIPPTISIISKGTGKTATVSAGRSGKELNRQKLKEQITYAIANSGPVVFDLPVEDTLKPVSQQRLEQTKALAQNLIGKTLTLTFEDNNWDLDEQALINFLSIYETYDSEKIASWSGLLANTIDREPQNALFNFEGDRVSEFKPAKAGVTLDSKKAIEGIKNGIQFLADNQDPNYSLSVPVIKTQPKITTDKVNDLGIKELIGTGESWFYNSIASRIHNLTLASSKMHGVLIPPGEEFSMLAILGEINAAQGYKPAYIIQNGRTVLGDGGGVCQASTTMFRAALNAGLDIKTRFPHAYRVSYYEANYDIGVDASIFSPTADFIFVNDTPGHVLIQVTVDPKEMYLRYDFYGTSDGRVVERSKSRMWDQAPPPPDLYQDDPSLPAGVVKQIDWSAWGAKTAFDWKVTRNGEVIHEKTFYSTYRPWQAVYLRGTAQ